MESHYTLQEYEDPDVLAEDNTRPSLPEDFPNFRDFQIEKMVQFFRVVTDGSEQRLRLGFKCKLCNEVFNKTMQLLGHIRNHFEDNHSCRDCGKYFFDTNKLNIHKRAKHTQSLRCQLGCPSYTTSNIKCLQTHYLRFHCVKIRPREMKKMDALGSLFRVSNEPEPKVRIRRGQVADQQRDFSSEIEEQQQQLPTAVQEITQIHIQHVPGEDGGQEEAEEEEEEEEEENEEEPETSEEQGEGEPEVEEDEFDELDDYEQPVECCVCDVYIPNEEVLREHEEVSHASPYSCKICSSAYELLEDARSHYETHEKPPGLQNPTHIQTITLTPGQHIQQTTIPIVTSHHPQQQQQTPTPTMTTMIIMHNGTPVLVPVQTFDSSQLVPAFPSQHQQPQHSQTQQATLTPITTAWPISQFLPVQNQIEIIPIHAAAAAAAAGTSAPQAIPIQNIINVRHEPSAAQASGIVITPIDQNYLRHQQALQAQLHLQQQIQQAQQQQQQQQQQYQQQS